MRSVPIWIGATDDAMPPPRVRLRADVADRLGKYEQRVLDKVTFDPVAGCWNWTGAHSPKGYGHMQFEGRFEKAYRVTYTLYVADIPPGAMLCHTCDNPRCCNPLHVWPGTARDNALDAQRKGRFRSGVTCGEANHFSKLTEDAVEIIRATPKTYGSGRLLALRFGVREAAICDIRAGRSWARK